MLLQTNSYIVPKDRRAEHARLLRRFRQTLARLGCDNFEVYEQVGANWNSDQAGGRFVQIMRFRDRRHQLAVQAAERTDPAGQALIAEFCELINFPYQQEHGYFAVGFYTSVLPIGPTRMAAQESDPEISEEQIAAAQASSAAAAATAEIPPPDQQTYDARSAVAADEHAAEPLAQDFPRLTEQADEEYVERELDELVKTFGEAPASEPAAAGESEASESVVSAEHASENGDSTQPRAADEAEEDRWLDDLPPATVPGAPIDDDNFADLLESHFGQPAAEPTSGSNHESGPGVASGGSGIGSVLDGGVLDNTDLDTPLPAELIDEADEAQPKTPSPRPNQWS